MLKRIMWIQHNRPRDRYNAMFTEYKDAKRSFKNAQKKAIFEINEQYYNELNTSAECDMILFWSLIKRKRHNKGNHINEIVDNGNTIREPRQIAETFKKIL